MPKINRTCRTPGCIQEGQTVNTGLRSCIHCGRTMEVPEPPDVDKPATSGFSGIIAGLAGYLGYEDVEEDV